MTEVIKFESASNMIFLTVSGKFPRRPGGVARKGM